MGSKRGIRAQVSMEFLMVVMFVFLLIVPLTAYYVNQSRTSIDEIGAAQTAQIARTIASNAETVHAYGEPTTFTLNAYLPEHVSAAQFIGTEIVFILNREGSNFTVSELVSMNISGSMNTTPGLHRIRIQSVNNEVSVLEVFD